MTTERQGAALLAVTDLSVAFPDGRRWVPVVRDVTFGLEAGEIVGLVGESGSGKTMTALSLLRLVPEPGRITGGRIVLSGQDLRALSDAELRRVRGARVAMIFQEPMTALNPVFSVGFQITEAIRAHRRVTRREARRRAIDLLNRVAIADAERRLGDYPHQLSGGQRQRVMIAMALAAEPDILVADEPTTALDVTIQAQILELLEDLRRQLGLALLLITHDLAVVAEICDRVLVMYGGEIVEEASAADLFRSPAHPYTRCLLDASPRLGRPLPRGRLPVIEGQVPEPGRLPEGCPFHPRCPRRLEACARRVPRLIDLEARRRARCLLYSEEGR